MARIIIADLHSIDSEMFIKNITNEDDEFVFGGQYEYRPQILEIGVKAVEFMLVIAAIDAISFLTTSFIKK
ncbi:hypothetical protein A0J48_013645 [Sphaerospermopsis aphanizomenoides BCCUSP55]|uniref:hypothetical protein n=1 Tax=Sphaerospermopsis aphanizomenoides TaxID=459663 RepID=UPI001906E192|nr:hypothetical protein [Sphaerospermopsis aphanizomenoides]MBK1988568.1 hypothetical protein [Sphaerospermopsis aphanizomenoides BCCUSP55]